LAAVLDVEVLDRLGLAARARRVVTLRDFAGENGSWLIERDGQDPVVVRRYHPQVRRAEVGYEHAVLRHLAGAGWVVPGPLGAPAEHEGLWYCVTRCVPGAAVSPEPPPQRRRRGCDLARLHLALRGLGERIGQRPGWQPQHRGVTVHTSLDWDACVRGLASVSPRLGEWAGSAAARTRAALAAIGAGELPVGVVHGDFAEWNVHYYQDGRLAGVIDFGLAHLDSRPFELAIARTYRSPETAEAYRAELARSGWPLGELEVAAIEPIYHAFRVDMTAWALDQGLRTGHYDLAMIERQLSRTGTAPP
jgi:homoserine kinase type II